MATPLPTILAEYEKLAQEASASNQTVEQYLLNLAELEVEARATSNPRDNLPDPAVKLTQVGPISVPTRGPFRSRSPVLGKLCANPNVGVTSEFKARRPVRT